MKSKKGITLIALIITIIVMLILVGVTINIVISGGLFGTTQDASSQMEEQAICEKIIALATWKNDGTIDVAETITEVEKEFDSVTDNGDGTYTIKGKMGEYKYEITSDKIAIANNNGNGLQLNENGFYDNVIYQYILVTDNNPYITYYMCFNGNSFNFKAVMSSTDETITNPPASTFSIVENPTYSSQQIEGNIIEANGQPLAKINGGGDLIIIMNSSEGYSLKETMTLRTDLDPDTFFNS